VYYWINFKQLTGKYRYWGISVLHPCEIWNNNERKNDESTSTSMTDETLTGTHHTVIISTSLEFQKQIIKMLQSIISTGSFVYAFNKVGSGLNVI
jgi:hypothetical protein